MKKKIVTIGVETDLNNNDLKNLYRVGLVRPAGSPDGVVTVRQVWVNLVKAAKK